MNSDETAGLVKVLFELDDDTLRPGETETLWAEDLGEGRFRLRNTPFYARGFSFHDVVIAVPDAEGPPVVRGAGPRSGHSTYRLFVHEGVEGQAFVLQWQPLERIGCSFEGATDKLIAVDVPADCDIHEVYRLLKEGEAAKAWDFEEGHCGHQVRS
ncbi:MAG: DUF4265 domain-containing protein [Planctomycetota bacterium]|jgi:hypothetical protein